MISAVKMSRQLSKLYRQKSDDEWERLLFTNLEWGVRRCELENEVDAHCLAGNLKAAQEPFRQLVEYLRHAIDERRG